MSTGRVAAVIVAALERAAARLRGPDDHDVARLAHRFGIPGFVARHRPAQPFDTRDDLARRFHAHTLADAAAEITTAFDASGVPHFFARGIVLLGSVYRPGDREIADIDLYVRPSARPTAVETLEALGYGELPEGQQGGPAALRTGTTLERSGPTGSPIETVQLDLHWGIHPIDRLLHTPDAAVPDLVWDGIRGGPPLPAPTVEHHAALIVQHLAYHDLLHVRGLLDLALLWDAAPRIDGQAFEAAARALGVLRVARALHGVLTSAFGLAAASGVALPPDDWRGRRLVRALALEEWMQWAAGASEADHLRMTPRRLRRRLLLVERFGDALRLLADAVRPPAAHLRWRWPEPSTGVGAWLRHVRHVAGTVLAPRAHPSPRLPRYAGAAILPTMEPETMAERPRARDDVVFRQLDEEWVLFDPVGDRLHALNLTGALIWTHLTGDRTLEEIAREVARAFDPPVPFERALTDVRAAVERFQRERLLAGA